MVFSLNEDLWEMVVAQMQQYYKNCVTNISLESVMSQKWFILPWDFDQVSH